MPNRRIDSRAGSANERPAAIGKPFDHKASVLYRNGMVSFPYHFIRSRSIHAYEQLKRSVCDTEFLVGISSVRRKEEGRIFRSCLF